jgi:DNA processing protein
LKHRARTVGVIGSGFDRFYPPENKTFVEKMAKQGAVLSEFPMSTPPDRQNFPRRNRLISALSLAVVVVEADETSGALITARLAAEQGRDVFAVPGSIFSKFSRGPHRLLKQGARPVETVEDILDEIEAFRRLIRRPRPAAVSTPPLTGVEGALMAHLSLEPLGVDTLASRSGLAVPAVLSALLELELKGLVRSLPGQTYVRAAAAA